MEDFEYYPDEEEEVKADEGSNRIFIYAVIGLVAMLAISMCVIIVYAVWGRGLIDTRNQAVYETNTAIVAMSNGNGEENGTPTDEDAGGDQATTEAPTETPEPTNTPRPSNTPEPDPTEDESQDETPDAGSDVVDGDDQEEPTDTPRPTVTPQPTATEKPESDTDTSDGDSDLPDTGIGTVGAIALAIGLIALLIVVRQIRKRA